jgi:hypothetical protein
MKTNERRSETTTNTRGARKGPKGRWAAVALGGAGAIALTAMLLVTPLVGATAIATFKAPYTGGTVVQYRDPTAQGCGAKLTVSHPAAFSLTTGLGTGAATARAGPCATSDSQATYDATVGVQGLAFTAGATTTSTVTASWTITWNATASMNAGAASAGGSAAVELGLLVKVYDATAKKWTNGVEHYLLNKDYSTAVTFAKGVVAGKYTATVAVGLVAGHVYDVKAVLLFSAGADDPQGAPSGSLATAMIDLGSTGHGGLLTGISVA